MPRNNAAFRCRSLISPIRRSPRSTNGVSCWCARTGTSRGAATPLRAMRFRSSIASAARLRYQKAWCMDQLAEEVKLETGTVRGAARDERGVLAFRGVPDAAAPVGELRWRAPQPAPAWDGVRDATAYGARCLSAWPGDVTT